MATFAKSTFNALTYAAFRPSYPPSLYSQILSYHHGPRTQLLDLGCGHGPISRALSPSFTSVLATDPSESMIAQARASSVAFGNIGFRRGSAEDLGFLSGGQEGKVDVVVAGQAAHWFEYGKVWGELGRVVRKGGTMAFWGYVDNVFVHYPRATEILMEYCYSPSYMGNYWEQPGRDILRHKLRAVVPPEREWEAVERVEYEPGEKGKEEVMMKARMKLGEMEGYARTFSAYHEWMAANETRKPRKDGGEGDVVDRMFDEMLEAEPEWRAQGEGWRDFEVEVEWGSYVLMARRR